MQALAKQTLLARFTISIITPLLLTLFAVIGGCSRDAGYPKDWLPAVTAADGECPDIAGTYLIEHNEAFTPTGYSGSTVTGTYRTEYEVAYKSLAGRHFHDENKSPWEVMTISGNPQEALQVVLYRRSSDAWINKAITLKKGSDDYQCKRGWLQSAWPGDTPLRDADDIDQRGLSKDLNFAKNRAGELIIRTDIQRWQEVSVWCGDGCKYVPIPFTREVTHTWARWSSAQIPTFAPPAPPPPIAQDPDADAPADESPAGRVTRILRTLTPEGVHITSVRADGERWIARFHGHTNDLVALHEQLMTSAALSDVTAKLAEPRDAAEKYMEFSFVTTAARAEREAKAAQEKAQAKIYAEREAEDQRIAKLFYGTFPNGATLTFQQRIENGYQMRVQCPDEETIYAVVVNANASGLFENIALKSKTRDQSGRFTGEITLQPRR